MDLRYYLRGLGIGITITAVLLIFLESDKKGMMTDAEIKKRAMELGMVESTTLANLSSENSSEDVSAETSEEPVSEEESEANTENDTEVGSEKVSESVSESTSEVVSEKASEQASEVVSEEASEPMSEQESEEASGNDIDRGEEYVIITVNRGDGSGTVAKRVYDAGLVGDAAEYDKYLCRNGYDKRIATGNHEIKVGSTEKEIAEILCSRQ